MVSRFHILRSFKELKEVVRSCKATKYACFDFETNAKSIYDKDFYPTILAISFQVGSAYILPLAHFESKFKDNNKWLKMLTYFGKHVIEDKSITKIAWNWKFDNQIMVKYGIHHRGRALDGMLAKYLLDEERPMGLKDMVRRYLPQFSNYEDYEGSKLAWDKKPLLGLSEYGGKDTDCTFRLTLFFEKKLIDLGFYSLYRNLIMMASRVLEDAERGGMELDIKLNNELNEKYTKLIEECQIKLRNIPQVKRFEKALIRERKEKYIEKLEDEVDNLKIELRDEGDQKKRNSILKKIEGREDKVARVTWGEFKTNDEKKIIEPINFGSVPIMGALLYTHKKGFKFPIGNYTDKGNPSTAEEDILKLRDNDKHGFIDALLDLRGNQTIYSTFVVGIGEKVGADGRIHPHFNIHGTVTGRLSSNNPNFQNLPRTTTNPDIKRMMVPGEGRLFLMLDYSQAELRVLAHCAKETTMLEWFRTGRDIHLATACKKYKVDYEDALVIYKNEQHPEYTIWKKRRKQAKTINFGIAYEQTAMKLSESLSDPEHGEFVSIEEAQIELDLWFLDFPRIKRYIEKQHKFAEKHGWVKTMFGRKRRLPGVYSEVYREYLEALRFSSNAPIQGTATDFALFSSILIWEKVKKGELPWIRECTTVHDSIVFEFYDIKDLNPYVIYQIWSICKNPSTKEYFGFQIDDVDMEVDFGIGRNYGEELPFVAGYDYKQLLSKDFDKDQYYKEFNKVRDIPMRDYPKKFKENFKKCAELYER